MAIHNRLGQEGERAAFHYIEQLGWRILERNWRPFGTKEADLIATDGHELIIVEVKTRTINYRENPLSAVDQRKKRNTIAIANTYVRFKKVHMPIRFDIITAVYHPVEDTFEIKHYKDAFRATVHTVR